MRCDRAVRGAATNRANDPGTRGKPWRARRPGDFDKFPPGGREFARGGSGGDDGFGDGHGDGPEGRGATSAPSGVSAGIGGQERADASGHGGDCEGSHAGG